ncbi:MAG: electron transfer flavoprotein subunit alpha/FixB family protein, partial [Proteobacteria bacterium]|nr:electron transfer flavoprotein subunit alpha/FixB family protein [Pseudomonadota bacterium]
AEKLSQKTGNDVVAVTVQDLVSYNAEVYKSVLEKLLPELNFAYVCVAGSTQGLDFAPALSVRLGAACIAGVERVFQEDGRIGFTRAVYGGKIAASLMPETEASIVVVQPGTFKPIDFDNPSPGKVETRILSCPAQQSRNIELKHVQEDNSALAEAAIVVAAGRGIGKEENLESVQRLASLFTRAAVAGSRPICDLGWMEYRQQVGITGATVAPDLYIACGVSGATQHISGMRTSGFIVSINLDPNAAIFNISDICLVEDLNTFIPVFIQKHEESKSGT